MQYLEFVETSYFTKRIKQLLSDDEYAKFQHSLLQNPERGNIISGGGGLRKIRHAIYNKGKSSGIRAIYYYVVDSKIYLLTVYPKSEKDDLSQKELNILKQLVKQELKHG